jgi:hypothetical protein
MAFLSLLIFLVSPLFTSNYQSDKVNVNHVIPINYDLSHPDKIYELSYSLHEISGITTMDASSIACIQDENGIIFFYDLVKEKINGLSYFYQNGDYEGIARAGKTIYVLRSDGSLFEVTGYESETAKTEYYSTGIPSDNIEGLCYDQNEDRLLIGPKGKVGDKSENKNIRFIYAFDLKSKKLIKNPVFVFDLKAIKKFARDNKIKVPMKHDKKNDKKEPDIEFRISEIGINPVTKKLYVLSGMEQLLFVFDMKGNIEYIERLDPDLYNQPEGIAFLSNGDMLISNESKNKEPTIVRCNYLK